MKQYFLDYIRELKDTLDKLDLEVFSQINDLLFQALKKEKFVFTMGNGGSGSTASHLVSDLNKGACFDQPKKFKALCLNDNVPTLLAYANDVSFSDTFKEQLKNFMQEGDVVIGFSGSGNSENVIKALDYANSCGGITIGFTGYDGGRISQIVKHSLIVPVHDMQKSEDIHFVLAHMIMRTMRNRLQSSCANTEDP
jgi:D-sedoheptulose 7-phosphate isomerase